MTPAIKGACYEWFAGLLIGMTPLFAHGILHLIADQATNWSDNWTGDILFVSITNSGLSAVTVFSRAVKATIEKSAASFALMGLTLILFLFSGMMYGVVAIGHARDITIWPSVALLLGSAFVSLVLEIAVAK